MSGIEGSVHGDYQKPGDVRQQIHQSIDLNLQMHHEPEFNSSSSNGPSELQPSMESMLAKELEEEIPMKGPEMGNPVEKEPSTENEEEDASVDMSLNLQPSAVNSEDEQPTYPRSSSATPPPPPQRPPPPPPPSPSSSISADPNNSKDVSEEDSIDSMPSLVLMGCTYCYQYVMVSEASLKCPKCGTSDLLDKSRGNPNQSKRKN